MSRLKIFFHSRLSHYCSWFCTGTIFHVADQKLESMWSFTASFNNFSWCWVWLLNLVLCTFEQWFDIFCALFFFFEKGGVKTEMIWCIGARGDEAPSLADVRERSCCGFVVLKKMVMWVPRIMKFIASDLVAQK